MTGAGHLLPSDPSRGRNTKTCLAGAETQRENRPPPRLPYYGCSLPLTTELAMTHSVVSD